MIQSYVNWLQSYKIFFKEVLIWQTLTRYSAHFPLKWVKKPCMSSAWIIFRHWNTVHFRLHVTIISSSTEIYLIGESISFVIPVLVSFVYSHFGITTKMLTFAYIPTVITARSKNIINFFILDFLLFVHILFMFIKLRRLLMWTSPHSDQRLYINQPRGCGVL